MTSIMLTRLFAVHSMLEVGNFQGPLNLTESRTHFGGWCIVSAPLILGMDITDSANVDAVWPIISNKAAIEVNQAWAGHPGRLVQQDPQDQHNSWQIWAKAMPDGGQAVFVVNRGTKTVNVSISMASIGLSGSSAYSAKDIWTGTAFTVTTGTWEVSNLGAHDSAFARLSKQ